MDVAALYPNCRVNKTCENIEESIINCGLKFDKIDSRFLTQFVSVITRGVFRDKSLQEFLQAPKQRTTINSFMKRQDQSQFHGPPIRQPGDLSDVQINKLLAIAAARSTKTVMENHFYQIGGKIYHQREGSAIGVDLSVESCSLYMTNWDQKFLGKLKKLGISIDMYFRYVDDTVLGLREIHHGWSYDRKKGVMTFDRFKQKTQAGDHHTFEQLQMIANSLDKDIQMTFDVPSLNESGLLPVLDLGLYIVNNQVIHRFYKKPMSSPFQIHYRSAIANRTKRETLLQEGIQILRNSGTDASHLERTNELSKLMNSLRISGYDQAYRYHILKGILNLKQKLANDIDQALRIR